MCENYWVNGPLNPVQTAVQKVKELEEELRKNMEKQDAEIQKQEAQFEKERAAHKVINHKRLQNISDISY